MAPARKAFTGLAYLFVLGIVIEVFLAGLGIFGDFHKHLDPHRAFGNVLVLVALVLLVLAMAGRLGRLIVGLTAALVVLLVLQSIWVRIDNRWVESIHPAMAIVLFALGHQLARLSRQPGIATA